MGRAKLQIKYREQLRARRSTYVTRWKGLKKKTDEISLLCGVQVLVASRSPEFNTVEFWPEKDTPEFRSIRDRYLCLQKKSNNSDDNGDEGCGNSAEQITCLPMPSSSMPSTSFSRMLFKEEMVAMDIKLMEIRERLHFLQADSHNDNSARQLPGEEELFLAQFTVSTPLQQDPLSYDPSSEFTHSHPADFANFNMYLQQDDLFMINLEQTSPPAPPLPPHDQLIPPLADINMCFQQDIPHPIIESVQCIPRPFEQPSAFPFHVLDESTPFDESLHHLVELNTSGMLPSDSPLWSNSDDWNWAESVFQDLESVL